MSSVLRLKPGTIVGGDYKISSLIAKGGMGAVYLAEQLSTECERALKVMHPELLNDAKARERFKQEARICSRIESDHVVKVIGSGIDEALGAPWLAMELIKGEDLAVYIKNRGPLPRADVLELFRQLCHGLGAAHRMGVVHRDLKLQNILVAPSSHSDSPFSVRVLDFGISKVLKEDAASDTTAAVGSPIWMAPEQAQKGKLGAATDIWPLGLIAFRLLTGFNYWRAANKSHPPIKEILYEVLVTPLAPASERAREYNAPVLPRGFDAWFAKAVARNPAERYRDASEAMTALAPVLASDEDEGPSRAREFPERETQPETDEMRDGRMGYDATASLKPVVPAQPRPFAQPPTRPKAPADPGYQLAEQQPSRNEWALGGAVGAPSPDTSGGHGASTTGGVSIQAPAPEVVRPPPPRPSALTLVGGGVLVGVLAVGAWLAYSHSQQTVAPTPPTHPTVVQAGPAVPAPPPPPPAPALQHATVLASGGGTSCVVVEHTVRCWGSNSAGQLGDGTTVDHPLPVEVRELRNVAAVAVGTEHACALHDDETVSCWGSNSAGQLGDDSTAARDRPVVVSGLHNVVQLALGARHSCARTRNGDVVCWGHNAFGQLGDRSNTPRTAPVQVRGVSNVIDVAARDNHTCAVLQNGSARCWGQNAHGELGDRTATDRNAPVQVADLSGATHIALGARHACAITALGHLRCWGANTHGELGDATTTGRPHAAEVPGLSGVVEVGLGSAHTCVRLSAGEVRCWGANNRGQLADGTTTERSRPEVALRGVNATALSVGAEHVCALTTGGEARCAGRNEHGELGHGTTDDSPEAVSVRAR